MAGDTKVKMCTGTVTCTQSPHIRPGTLFPTALMMSEGKRGREAEEEHSGSKKAHVEEEETDALVVCGIDLGRTCTRYAFACTRRPAENPVSCSLSLALREMHAPAQVTAVKYEYA